MSSQKSTLKLRVMELYRANQILWNPNCSAYRNHLFREKAWKKCADQLQMPADQFKRMTTSLRSYYNRLRKSPSFSANHSPEWIQLADSFLPQLGEHVAEPYDEEQFVRELSTDIASSSQFLNFEFEPINFPSGRRRMTDEIAQRLILLYKEMPVLWQPNHPHYNVVFHRNQAWQCISECVNVTGLTPAECKKEVHQIRSRYVLKRKNMTDSEVLAHNVDWFQLAHSFLDAVLFERNDNGDLVLVNVRQGQKKYKPQHNVSVSKSVFLKELETVEEYTFKCRVCLTTLESNGGTTFAEGDSLYSLYSNLIDVSPLAHGPDRICGLCEAQILEFAQFRNRCRANEEALIAAHKNEMAADFIEIETLEVEHVGTTDSVASHVADERLKDPTRVICELCRKDFVSQYNLNTHLRNIHGIERIEVDESGAPLAKEKKTTANICPKCGKKVLSLASHMKSHQPLNSYSCPSCDKAYKSHRNLRVHQRSAHEGVTLTCAHCPTKFRSWSGRQDHYLLKHTITVTHLQCPFCSRTFPADRILKRHIRQLHSSRTHKCDQCEAVFTRSTNLQAHIDAKHGGKLNLLPCAVCDKRFGSKKQLQQHFVVHTGEKNYPCPVCPTKFAQNHVLRTHIRQLHKSYQLPPKGTVTNVRALQRLAHQLL